MAWPALPICLEGNAGTGKTTCCTAIAASVKGLFVPEYTETLDAEHLDLLKRSFECDANHDESSIWRLAEQRRVEILARKHFQFVLLDTSLISVVAFELARLRFARSGNVAAIVRAYREQLSGGNLALPGKIIHLKTSEAVRQTRIAKRGSCHPFLTRTDVAQYLDEIRINCFEQYLPRKCWMSIDTSILSPDEATNRIVHDVEGLEEKQMSKSLTAWLSSFLH